MVSEQGKPGLRLNLAGLTGTDLGNITVNRLRLGFKNNEHQNQNWKICVSGYLRGHIELNSFFEHEALG